MLDGSLAPEAETPPPYPTPVEGGGIESEGEPLEVFPELERLETFRYSHEQWLKMRKDYEQGTLPEEGFVTPLISPYDLAVSTEIPRPPPPELELPTYGTSLSITGRKVISFNFSEKKFINEQKSTLRPRTTNLFDIKQELQLRMQGKVGPKITVNVDYDDTKTNKQDISVVYQGDPNEVVQNASFGDIDLSLPSTEFVSYNKQLFGIRADLKYKRAKFTFVGSRIKGVTKSKQFFGNTEFRSVDLQDTSYIRRQHYDLTFGSATRLPLAAGSEKVFLARQVQGQLNVNDLILTVDDLNIDAVLQSTAVFTSTFTQLAPGQDYSVDYIKGILTLKITAQPQFALAVDFVDATGNRIAVQTSTGTSGGTGRFKLIKTPSDIQISTTSELGFKREMKTFYNIGQTQIIRDNFRGNFFLKVFNQSRAEVGPSLNPAQSYPSTILVDFENGTFQLTCPFGDPSANPANTSCASPAAFVQDQNLYAPAPIGRNLIHVEYRHRFKTFFLEPNLVLQSEYVLLDGARLARNADYYIDYESGFLTFYNEERIKPESQIDVSYEVAPFFGGATDSLLGTRVSYDILNNWSVGSTLLYQTGVKPPVTPPIQDLARSLLVYEVDSQLKGLRFTRFLNASFAGEFAQSRQNPNLSGFALIDSMEGVRLEDSASVLFSQWAPARNPDGSSADGASLSWASDDVKTLDINPKAPANAQDTQKVLKFNYDFTSDGSTKSIVFPFSDFGLDFSQKSILEVVIEEQNSKDFLNFHLGGINEDADGDGALDTEDTVVKDGILNTDEDTGWDYDPPDVPTPKGPLPKSLTGEKNGRLDSEDLNHDGRLATQQDQTGDSFGYAGANKELFDATCGSTITALSFPPTCPSAWHTLQIPLKISTSTANLWTAVKQIRISVAKGPGATGQKSVRFARISVVGNTWVRGEAGDPSTKQGAKAQEALDVTPINNVENQQYAGRAVFEAGAGKEANDVFTDLYGSLENLQRQSNTKNISEQALALTFRDLPDGATVFTRRQFTRALDLSSHKRVNWLIFGNADSNNVDTSGNLVSFMRFGSEQQFFEARVPLNFQGWKKVALDLADTNGDKLPDQAQVAQGPAGTVVVSSGAPSFQQVGQIVTGIYNRTGATKKGTLYLNEIHVSEPNIRTGEARKFEGNFDIPGWASFGAKHRNVDRNFQTPTSVVSNQDNRQDSAYVNLSRPRFFPMAFNLARTITDTPNTAATGNLSNFITLLSQGRVTKWGGTASGNLSLWKLPRLSLGYSRDRTEYDLATRLDDKQTYTSNTGMTVPWDLRVIPKTIDLNYSHSRYLVGFQSPAARAVAGNFDTDELTQTYGAKLGFVPWGGSRLDPSYSLTEVREKRTDFTLTPPQRLEYPKSRNQTVTLNSSVWLREWLQPSFNYTLTSIENNNLLVTTFTVTGSTPVAFGIGDLKTLNRQATGGVNLSLNMGQILPRVGPLKSLTLSNNYQLQDGDIWTNLEKDLDSRTKLWVRTPLRPRVSFAQRTSLTLRDTYNSSQRWNPLEAFEFPGRMSVFKSLSMTNNYLKSIQRSETTGTKSKTVSTTLPDLIASLSGLERLLYAERYASNAQVNVKFAVRKTETVLISLDRESSLGSDLRSILFKKFDTSLALNVKNTEKKDLRIQQVTQRTRHMDSTLQTTFDIKAFRFTPKVDYALDTTELGTGQKTQDIRVITPSVLVRADLSLPKGLALPFTSKVLEFTNRIIWTTTASLADRKSPITQADNSKLFNLTTSGDYEIAKNLRMTLNGSVQRLWHKFQKEDEFISYQFGTTLTFQF